MVSKDRRSQDERMNCNVMHLLQRTHRSRGSLLSRTRSQDEADEIDSTYLSFSVCLMVGMIDLMDDPTSKISCMVKIIGLINDQIKIVVEDEIGDFEEMDEVKGE